MRKMYFSLGCLAVLALAIPPTAHAFLPSSPARAGWTHAESSALDRHRQLSLSLTRLGSTADSAASNDDDDDEIEKEPKINPFADPNYPDLEFIDYSDPEYQVDQGIGEEFSDPNSTDAQIEAMRQDRRRRNDEYQFQTYFAEFLKKGDEYMGEWTVYKTSTFLPSMPVQADGLPRLVKAGRPLKVVSSAYKTKVETDSPHPTDAERIRHEERAVSDSESDSYDKGADDKMPPSPEAKQTEKEIMKNTYWPEQLAATDFQGQQGTMCVGSAYTIATGVSLSGKPLTSSCEGPFKEYRAEVGLQSEQLRFRVKFDYSVVEAELKKSTTASPPPLHLKSMTVCRETRGMWPLSGEKESVADRAAVDALFGTAGASGGLYDPPPVGSEEQAGQYMVLDLQGQATVLFPIKMDQSPEAFGGTGWVTSLDWTPDTMRYQVDRKVKGGADLMCLRTLEVTEVQGMDADRYRPRDGGEDMRQ
jgi:hypothetical protein